MIRNSYVKISIAKQLHVEKVTLAIVFIEDVSYDVSNKTNKKCGNKTPGPIPCERSLTHSNSATEHERISRHARFMSYIKTCFFAEKHD